MLCLLSYVGPGLTHKEYTDASPLLQARHFDHFTLPSFAHRPRTLALQTHSFGSNAEAFVAEELRIITVAIKLLVPARRPDFSILISSNSSMRSSASTVTTLRRNQRRSLAFLLRGFG